MGLFEKSVFEDWAVNSLRRRAMLGIDSDLLWQWVVARRSTRGSDWEAVAPYLREDEFDQVSLLVGRLGDCLAEGTPHWEVLRDVQDQYMLLAAVEVLFFVGRGESGRPILETLPEWIAWIAQDQYFLNLCHLYGLCPPGARVYRVHRAPELSRRHIARVPALSAVEAASGRLLETSESSMWEVPEPGVIMVRNAVVYESGLITVGEDIVVYDPAADPCLDWASGQIGMVAGHFGAYGTATVVTADVLMRPSGRVPSATHVLGRNCQNYWHALVEYAPRAWFAIQKGGLQGPLIWSARAPSAASEALRYATPSVDVLELPPGDAIRVDELHIPSLPTRAYDTLIAGQTRSCGANSGWLRGYAQTVVERSGWASAGDWSGQDIVITRRSGYRNFRGFELLEDAFLLRGGGVIALEDLDLRSQIALFQTARTITSVGGAAWANLVFSTPRLRCVNVVTTPQGMHPLHQLIAEAQGVRMATVLAPRDWLESYAPSFNHALHCNGVFNERVVSETLRLVDSADDW